MSASDNTVEINEDNAETLEVLQKGLNEKVAAYEAQCEVIEKALVEYALEHNLHLNLGYYGSGRTLLLKDDKWAGKQRGEWLYSSDNC
jgi:hypothetical protein